MKNKWLIIGIAIVVIIAGILIATNVGGETNVSQPVTPATPIAPTPVQTPLAVTNKPAPAGVIKITAEELVKQLMANPNKYQEGTVFQVSGVFLWERKSGLWPYESIDFFLSSKVYVDDRPLGVRITVKPKEKKAFRIFNSLSEDDGEVVVQGTYYFLGKQAVHLENVSLVSVTPAK